MASYPIVIRFRATLDDRTRLERVAQHYERAPSDVLRRLLTEAEARLPARGSTKPKKE